VIVLRPVNLRWINGAADDPADFCAHGDVEFRIGDDTLVEPSGRELTVSAAALYLLRTLSVPHTREAPSATTCSRAAGSVCTMSPASLTLSSADAPTGRTSRSSTSSAGPE
jgi:hypothetical protein